MLVLKSALVILSISNMPCAPVFVAVSAQNHAALTPAKFTQVFQWVERVVLRYDMLQQDRDTCNCKKSQLSGFGLHTTCEDCKHAPQDQSILPSPSTEV